MLDQTLEQLEGEDWGEPTYQSHVVINCHRLRRVPLQDFTIEDLRLMVGQKIGLEYLVPLALVRLECDPLVSGDYYKGDLLESVQRLPGGFWEQYPELRERWLKIQVTLAEHPAV